jgi:hypothetical protein
VLETWVQGSVRTELDVIDERGEVMREKDIQDVLINFSLSLSLSHPQRLIINGTIISVPESIDLCSN